MGIGVGISIGIGIGIGIGISIGISTGIRLALVLRNVRLSIIIVQHINEIFFLACICTWQCN